MSAPSEPRVIASVASYSDLHSALRARAEELKVTRLSLDAVSGLQSGCAGKVLAPTPVRGLGRVSLGPMLQVLGLRLAVVEDTTATAFLKRLEPRRTSHACQTMPARQNASRSQFAGNSDWGKRLAALRWLGTPRWKALRLASCLRFSSVPAKDRRGACRAHRALAATCAARRRFLPLSVLTEARRRVCSV